MRILKKSGPNVSLLTLFSFLFLFSGGVGPLEAAPSGDLSMSDGRLTVSAAAVQDKVLEGSDGTVGLEITLFITPGEHRPRRPAAPVDLVLVLDCSGSMAGMKIAAARQAALRLVDRMSAADRLALIAYADGVRVISPLCPVDAWQRRRLAEAIEGLETGGSTNLGGGLHQGIDLILAAPEDGRQRRILLISDGLANRGVTDPMALGRMAATATDYRFSVSTVGVGLDFNEDLMTLIADHGVGRYYFLEDPLVFSRVFEKELDASRRVAAGDLALFVPLEKGVRLLDAGGYPVEPVKGGAVIRPGALLEGERRTFYLTFEVPTRRQGRIVLGGIEARYLDDGRPRQVTGMPRWTVSCVSDEAAVMQSVNPETWSGQVVKEAFGRLKDEVADAVRKGDLEGASRRIEAYEAQNGRLNAVVGSPAVAEHLEKDVKGLRQSVRETFTGPPAAVSEKQKSTSKALQYESYQNRRDKK